MRAIWHEGILTDIHKLSSTKMTFTMKIDAEAFHFEPGQFVTMDLPLGEKRRQRWRSYSIANIPNNALNLEFGIGYLTDGLASDYFFNQLKIGDSIKFKGPEGAFVLPENLAKPIVMIATGTGVVPFMSMIRCVMENKLPFQSIHLIYGTRFEKDILYRKELEEYLATNDKFKVDFVLSREEKWMGPKGYVHDVYKEHYTEKEAEIFYMLCGWTSMIDEAMANLFKLVMSPPKQIKYELYG